MAWIFTLPMLVAQAANSPAAAPVTQAANATAADGLPGFWKLAIAVAIIFGSFGLGTLLARALRLPEYGFKLGLIALSTIGSLAICYFGWPPKLGIDLSGGVVLIYEVESNAAQANKLEEFADRVAARLNDGRQEKIVAKVVDDKIEIRLPADADVATVENQIANLRTVGVNLNKAGKREEQNALVVVYEPSQSNKVDMDKLIGAINLRINPGGLKELTVRQYGPESLEIIVPEVDEGEIQSIKNRISRLGTLEFRILANQRQPEHLRAIEKALASKTAEVFESSPDGRRLVAKWVTVDPQKIHSDTAVFRPKADGKHYECLVMKDIYDVHGEYLRNASADIDEAGGNCIKFSFNSKGAQLFGQLTGANLPDPQTGIKQHLGILLDGELQSAPTLQSQIRDTGQITGDFTQEQVKEIVDILNAGSLPTALNKTPVQEQRISAQLGADTIMQGSKAMFISFAGVILFMLLYYRFAGAVADGAVIINLIMAVASMILVKAAFTLPGLAGLVLTVGMAVDANVLIYERMREEQQRGASLRMAIRNGYARAFSTIIDSHVTTISTGIVLFMIGSDQIKGFAVTLILGLFVSLYTAVYVSRVVFDIFEKKRWLTKLNMMQWFKKTNIDFVGMMRPAGIFSLVVIAIGMIAVAARGLDLLDIDFTGGYSVQIQFKKDQPQDIAEVRREISLVLPDTAVSAVGADNLEFKIDTSEHDPNHVRETLKKVFDGKLSTYSMTYKNLKPYSKPTDDSTIPANGKQSSDSEGEAKQGTQSESSENKTPVTDPEETKELTPPEEESSKPPADTKSDASPSEASPSDKESSPSRDAEKKSASLFRTSLLNSPSELVVSMLAVSQVEAKDDSQPDETESAAVSTIVELHFPEAINYATLHDRLLAELEEQKLAGTTFELKNSEYASGSSLRYSDWTLIISLSPEKTEQLIQSMQQKLAAEPVFPYANKIGGKVAGKTQSAAIYAILASLVIIVVYVWVRFQNVMFGFAAVLALIHDVLVTLGFLALSYWITNIPFMEKWLLVDPFKISLAVVAALLTIVGYSINDTIVIFDRIREMRGKSPELTGTMINQAVNETLSRTFITSGTVFIATIILYFVGGAGIHPFAYAMLVGVISGTYSTVYIAAPVLLWLKPPKADASSSPRRAA